MITPFTLGESKEDTLAGWPILSGLHAQARRRLELAPQGMFACGWSPGLLGAGTAVSRTLPSQSSDLGALRPLNQVTALPGPPLPFVKRGWSNRSYSQPLV